MGVEDIFLPVLASGLFPLRNFHSICAKGGLCLRVALSVSLSESVVLD